MKQFFLFLLVQLFLFLSTTSCIREEAANAECDITAVEEAWLNEQKDILIGSPIITNDHVTFSVKAGTDRTALAPRFTLTEGASLTALVDGKEVEANGITRNFTSPQTYTTHSEDGAWGKDYNVSFSYPIPIEEMSFEHYDLDGSQRYQVWYEVDPTDEQNPRRDYWANGNSGYAILGIAKKSDAFPTVSIDVGVKGNGVKLTTLNTGSYGKLVGMPIAAGSIFLGSFHTEYAMSYPRLATHFGLQLVVRKPLRLEGFYKYTAGETFTDKDKNVCPERHDTADIYAVIYEASGHYTEYKNRQLIDSVATFAPLQGDNILSDPRIVMMARIDNPGEPQDWTKFSEVFKLLPGKTFSEEILANNGYAIAVVATSSRQGAYFEGAIGSTLYIDELRIVWEGEEE